LARKVNQTRPPFSPGGLGNNCHTFMQNIY
jgi:hypothetical protein